MLLWRHAFVLISYNCYIQYNQTVKITIKSGNEYIWTEFYSNASRWPGDRQHQCMGMFALCAEVYAVQPAKSEEWGSGKLTGMSSARDLKGFQKRVVFKDAKMLKVTFGGQTWMVWRDGQMSFILSQGLPLDALHPWEFPQEPWHHVHIDIGDPIEGKMILVPVETRENGLKWLPWDQLPQRRHRQKLGEMFRRFRSPTQLVSGNGSQFVSKEMNAFLQAIRDTILHQMALQKGLIRKWNMHWSITRSRSTAL